MCLSSIISGGARKHLKRCPLGVLRVLLGFPVVDMRVVSFHHSCIEDRAQIRGADWSLVQRRQEWGCFGGWEDHRVVAHKYGVGAAFVVVVVVVVMVAGSELSL